MSAMQRENQDVARRLEKAVKQIPATRAEEKLSEIRDIVMEVMPLDRGWWRCCKMKREKKGPRRKKEEGCEG